LTIMEIDRGGLVYDHFMPEKVQIDLVSPEAKRTLKIGASVLTPIVLYGCTGQELESIGKALIIPGAIGFVIGAGWLVDEATRKQNKKRVQKTIAQGQKLIGSDPKLRAKINAIKNRANKEIVQEFYNAGFRK
jgi:hypothetical protein